MELKGLVFDMDWTLYDRAQSDRAAMERFFPDHRDLFKEGVTLKEAQDAMVEADRYGCHFGWGRIREILAGKGVMKEPLPDANWLYVRLQELYAGCGVPFPDAEPTLKELHRRGFRLGIITNGKEIRQIRKIEHFGFSSLVDAILIGGSDKSYAKPEKPIFWKMAGELELEPEELCYVGDDPKNDIEGARNAGYRTIWIRTMPWDYPDIRRADKEIDRLGDLLPLFPGQKP